jgi:DUF438 domain-containing protein
MSELINNDTVCFFSKTQERILECPPAIMDRQMQGKFIHIRYFAIRDEKGAYKGPLEVTQDISEIRQLDGERRLLDDEPGSTGE